MRPFACIWLPLEWQRQGQDTMHICAPTHAQGCVYMHAHGEGAASFSSLLPHDMTAMHACLV